MSMSLQRKLVVTGGAILVAGLVAVLITKFAAASPIDVGDGSILFEYHSGGIDQHTNAEIEASKWLHKVKSIKVHYYNSAEIWQNVDVKGSKWRLTSNNTPDFLMSLSSHWAGLENGVLGDCNSTTGWTMNSATSYTCTPNNGSKLLPATLTFLDGGTCPLNGLTSCTLMCPDQTLRCELELEYK